MIHGVAGSTAQAYAERYDRTFEEIKPTASGTCGENITWALDDEGLLTISGSGNMAYWESTNDVPWYEQKTLIKKAVIEDGATSIGEYAFSGCSSLTEIAIPDSVTRIGSGAFKGCTGLTGITIPDIVTYIGVGAFANCSRLKAFIIPDNVVCIDDNAFENCAALKEITVPERTVSIGKSAFSGCAALKDITVLNPECDIDTDASAISDTAVIHGYAGSPAQNYAEKYSRTFEEIKTVDSGTCGENLTWTLDNAGRLKISGKGKMATPNRAYDAAP